jgi:rod shape-determining protein MreD
MTRWNLVFYLILAYLALVIDVSTGFSLSLLLVVLVVLTLREGRSWALPFGFLSGFVLDCFSPRFLGLNGLLFGTIGYLLGSISERVYTNRLHLTASIIFVTSLVYLSAYILVTSFNTFPSIFISVVLKTALYNTAIGIPLFYSTHKLCPKTP